MDQCACECDFLLHTFGEARHFFFAMRPQIEELQKCIDAFAAFSRRHAIDAAEEIQVCWHCHLLKQTRHIRHQTDACSYRYLHLSVLHNPFLPFSLILTIGYA